MSSVFLNELKGWSIMRIITFITESQLEQELSRHMTGFKYSDNLSEVFQPCNFIERDFLMCLMVGRRDELSKRVISAAFISCSTNIFKSEENGQVTYSMDALDIGRVGQTRHIKIEL